MCLADSYLLGLHAESYIICNKIERINTKIMALDKLLSSSVLNTETLQNCLNLSSITFTNLIQAKTYILSTCIQEFLVI